MEVKNIFAQGFAGVDFSLNIFEAYELKLFVDGLDKHYAYKEALDKWDMEKWNIPAEEREEWRKQNPRPEERDFSERDMLERCYIFLSKLSKDIPEHCSTPSLFQRECEE